MQLPHDATRNLLFTGKGGVGKTSVACAAAIALADKRKRILLVSTDPASNLDEVLDVRLGTRPTPVPGVHGLFAMNVDPEQSAREYRERVVAPYRELLPESAVQSIEEQLSGACTVEIAAFDEFAKLLGESSGTAEFDHVIFDTAPTGHTLRLLQLPAAWANFINSSVGGTSCLGPLAGLEAQRSLYENTVRALSNPALTTVFLVSRPEPSALAEAERTRLELHALGITHHRLVLNGVFRSSTRDDAIARSLEERGRQALGSMPDGLSALQRIEIPLVARSLIGVEALRGLAAANTNAHNPKASSTRQKEQMPSGLASLISDLVAKGSGVIVTMGKGGVGKTTIAAQIAVALSERGYSVHLTTTDPAAHVQMAVRDDLPNLRVSRIDPLTETAAYTAEVMAEVGSNLDEKGRALLEEDLRSPCTEEIAVFRAFARSVDEGNHRFVVIDTAPTGHTLLLLDAAEAYHRDVERNLTYIPDSVRRLLPQLRNSDFTRVLIVTLPEATPVHEAARLQDDLRRAGIIPFAWVINQSLAGTDTSHPVLAARAALEHRYIGEVRDRLAKRVALIPWLAEPTAEESDTALQATVEIGGHE